MDRGRERRGEPHAAVAVPRAGELDRGEQQRQRRRRHHVIDREPGLDAAALRARATTRCLAPAPRRWCARSTSRWWPTRRRCSRPTRGSPRCPGSRRRRRRRARGAAGPTAARCRPARGSWERSWAPPEPSRATQRSDAAEQAPGIGAEDVVRRDRAPQLVERLDAAAKARAAGGEARDVDAAGRDAGEDGDLEIGSERREPAQDADLIGAAGTAAGEEHGERAAVAVRHQQANGSRCAEAGLRRQPRRPAPPAAALQSRHARPSRSRRHRQRTGRLRRRHPRRAARPRGHGGREGPVPGRHLPAPRLHPDQGAAPHRRPARGGARRRASSASPAPSRSSTSPRRISTSRRWCARTRRGSSRCSARTASRWCTGRGRLDGPRRVVVEGDGGARALDTRHVLIATGSAVRALPFLPFDGKRVLSSDHILELASVPARLAILGAGAVGVEFASMFAAFGSKVTLIEMLPRVLPLEDEEISAALEKSLGRRGIEILTGTSAAGARVARRAASTLELSSRSLEADVVLVAVGRRPVTEELGPRSRRRRARARLRARRPLHAHRGAGDLRHRRRGADAAARPSRLGGGDPRGRAHRRPRSAADRLRPGAVVHLLRSRGGERRAHRGEGARARLRRRGREVPVHRVGRRPRSSAAATAS